MEEQVVLVNEANEELGLMGKREAHEKGLLHRAISVVVFNRAGKMLVQQRAFSKYHWAGIWSNTCCSHPRAGETFQQAAERRLYEELGIRIPLQERFFFIYKATDEASGLTEHELDYVFTGVYDGEVNWNKDEVNDIRWMSADEVLTDMAQHPHRYSFWFKIILDEMKKRNII
ncbi:MAG: isopentenyl-diphosphate Delta-isomerase [Chitinophagales bacterium]|nr:isopentenyl-diphosphate Delta-isomerase [Chitinophagales bacterium]MDW8420188.1 isopentenyl-diphosphate Delta-isomerase [Chitinophagales bacterium]